MERYRRQRRRVRGTAGFYEWPIDAVRCFLHSFSFQFRGVFPTIEPTSSLSRVTGVKYRARDA